MGPPSTHAISSPTQNETLAPLAVSCTGHACSEHARIPGAQNARIAHCKSTSIQSLRPFGADVSQLEVFHEQ